ncbi:helix-turn-helix domain-containing protein [Intrasporangium calvum]|uniref:helix-turn-helix domain-containing protein n=1 Tax=Intrasporangium calvum TaxID=53358 RepID=UPI000DF5D3CF|nr:helix-turn-helix domain-containing protein [Intrasporangium calvum]AXG14523.1 hypothetical protein DN585_14880 [Intrasporangium calvum]
MTTAAKKPAPSTVAHPTATTVADLVARANSLTEELLQSDDRVSLRQWESFDQTLYQLLSELVSARRVGPGPVDRSALLLYDVVKNYPTPLMPARPVAAEFGPNEAARLLGVTHRTVRKSILRGNLPAARTDTGWLIRAEDLQLRQDVRPADAGNPDSLSRLAVTLGALTDVVHGHQQDSDKPAFETGSVNRLTHDVLAIAVQTARHSLHSMGLADVQRPLAVARHVEAALKQLAPVAIHHELPYAAVPPPSKDTRLTDRLGSGGPVPEDLPGRLDRALADWAHLARAEQSLSVPSIDVLRNVTSQSIHMYAAIDVLLTAGQGDGTKTSHRSETAREELRAAARTLQRAGAAWGHGITGTRPSRDYVEASQRLHDVLESTIDTARDASLPLARQRLLGSLTAACPSATALIRQHASIAHRLIDAGALLAPAKTLGPSADRLQAEARGRYVPVRYSDLPHLVESVVHAEVTSSLVARSLAALRVPQPLSVASPEVAAPEL